MKAEVQLIFLPYAEEQKQTLVDVLVRELSSGQWSQFLAAVAFVRLSGNVRELLDGLRQFAAGGGRVEMTFGANTFFEGEGSDYEAIEMLLDELNGNPNAKIYLYYQPDRTFHPKMYLFSNEKRALLIVGSSNWSQGGLQRNIEVNVLVHLDLEDPEHKTEYQKVIKMFETYWREVK